MQGALSCKPCLVPDGAFYTASIDYGKSTLFVSHQILSRGNIPILENLSGLGELPPVGATLVALPMKIDGGSGAPLRAAVCLPGR